MAIPPQLARAKRPKRSAPRPLVEELPRLEIADLCRFGAFPNQTNWHARYLLELPFRYPFLRNLVLSLQAVEANHHSGYNQTIPLRWIRTGFGGNSRPRPLLICQCGRTVTKLYFRHANLACRQCCNATYASRTLDKRTRPVLQAVRLRTFLELKSGMLRRNRQRLKARIASAPIKELNSKRLAHHSIQLPQSNYSTRGSRHWR
jgi:hypothetical protein